MLAKVRNHLLSRALVDEEWVLWLDVDVTGYPADLIQRLLGARKDIVVPHCATEPGGPTYDLNTFALQPRAGTLNWSQWLRDGILQPPRGSVGGTSTSCAGRDSSASIRSAAPHCWSAPTCTATA